MRMSAEPTVLIHGRTPPHWTKRCGAMSASPRGSLHGDYAVSVSSSSGRGRPRSGEYVEESRRPASPVCRASCCSTSSGVRPRPHVEVSGPGEAVEAVERVRFGI